MENSDLIAITSVILSGAFSVAASIIAATFSINSIIKQERLKWQSDRIGKLETVYSALIGAMSAMINNAHNRKNNMDCGLETLHSQVELLGSKPVILAINNWVDKYNEWVSAYVESLPKPIGETGLSTIRSGQEKFHEKAKELYPEMMKAGQLVIFECRNHLEALLNNRR
jgi:hypothetical protein